MVQCLVPLRSLPPLAVGSEDVLLFKCILVSLLLCLNNHVNHDAVPAKTA